MPNNIDKLEQAWYTLTDEQRWKRLPEVQLSNKSIVVMLDNDITYIVDTQDDDFYLEFDEYVGCKDGVIPMLKAFNIKSEPV